jgi:hypothetical protein
MRKQLQEEFPGLPAETAKRELHFEEACAEILAKYKGDPAVAAVLAKIRSRKGVKDMHLCGVLPAGLLAIVWADQVTLINEPELYEHFRLTLIDIGGTCLQGDTHRLFATYVALSRDIQQSVVD